MTAKLFMVSSASAEYEIAKFDLQRTTRIAHLFLLLSRKKKLYIMNNIAEFFK